MVDSRGCIVCQCPSTGIDKLRVTLGKSRYLVDHNRLIGKYIPSMRSVHIHCICKTWNYTRLEVKKSLLHSPCICVGSSNSSATSSQTATSGGNGINGCPPFPKSCDSSCVKLDDLGCVICSCPRKFFTLEWKMQILHCIKDVMNKKLARILKALYVYTWTMNQGTNIVADSSNNSSQAQTGVQQTGHYVNIQGQGSAGNGNGCPSLDPNCPAQCTTPDDSGCIRCTCKHYVFLGFLLYIAMNKWMTSSNFFHHRFYIASLFGLSVRVRLKQQWYS